MDPAEDENLVEGDEAIITVADLLYQMLRLDMRFQQHCAAVDLKNFAVKLRSFLANVFDAQAWPKVRVTAALVEARYDDFAQCLEEAMQQSTTSGEDAFLAAFDLFNGELKDDARVLSFFEHLRTGAVLEEEEQALEETPPASPRGDALQDAAQDDSDAHNQQGEEYVTHHHSDFAGDEGNNIIVESLETLDLPADQISAVQETWRVFIESAGGKDPAGDAIFASIFENVPTLKQFFISARAVFAMKFMDTMSIIVRSLSNADLVAKTVGTVAFGHYGYEITGDRFSSFRDALLDVFRLELQVRFTSTAQQGWRALMNYIGGIFIFVKANFHTRIRILQESWMLVSDDTAKDQIEAQVLESSTEIKDGGSAKEIAEEVSQFFGNKKENAAEAEADKKDDCGNQPDMGVPTTFPDMFRFNASVMGFGKRAWFTDVLACFDNVVRNVANSMRLQQECDVLALRIGIAAGTQVNLFEFKSCMLASMRSLLPGVWDSEHEVAWSWLWENVSNMVSKTLGKPEAWEKTLGKHFRLFTEAKKQEMRKAVYVAAFGATPALQEHFKQSDTRLNFIAARIMDMSVEIYKNPPKMVDMISAVGLRHVGYGIPVSLIGDLTSAYIEVVSASSSDPVLKESFTWSLGLLAKITASTINEGSTIVMKAINVNSSKELKQAIRGAPRKARSTWMLMIKVGSQDISPLAWAIESGSLEAAATILHDLLTIRADRERYYYGGDELFARHPDIVKRLCTDAPTLLPVLLDGLLWRSRITENSTRRVNYYIKHLIVDAQGGFAKNLEWIIRNKDPKIVCHSVMLVLSTTVWKGCAYLSFLYQKSWFFLTLLIFITSQSFLEHLNEGENGQLERSLVFGCRCFIYCLSLTQLVFVHANRINKAFRESDLHRYFLVSIPAYLENWQDSASLALTLSLFLMLCTEPIIHCWPSTRPGKSQAGKVFVESCPTVKDMAYSIFSCIAMFLYYLLLIDLAVFSTRVSAYVLVCFRMAYELMLFLLASGGSILAFSSAISVIKHETSEFDGIAPGAAAMSKMLLGTYSDEENTEIEKESMMLLVCSIFSILVSIFLVNLLIAQLNCAYSQTYSDMVGYAILKRIKIIVETMPAVSVHRWGRFINKMEFGVRLEFNEGDIGLAGGIQIRESASEHPTTVDTIKRFGGSTSPSLPWPIEDDREKDDATSRMDRIEHIINRFDAKSKKIEKALRDLLAGAKEKAGSVPSSGCDPEDNEDDNAI